MDKFVIFIQKWRKYFNYYPVRKTLLHACHAIVLLSPSSTVLTLSASCSYVVLATSSNTSSFSSFYFSTCVISSRSLNDDCVQCYYFYKKGINCGNMGSPVTHPFSSIFWENLQMIGLLT